MLRIFAIDLSAYVHVLVCVRVYLCCVFVCVTEKKERGELCSMSVCLISGRSQATSLAVQGAEGKGGNVTATGRGAGQGCVGTAEKKGGQYRDTPIPRKG